MKMVAMVDRVTIERIAVIFSESLMKLEQNLKSELGRDPVFSEELASAIEGVGRRLRDECCERNLRMHAMLAKEILTIATTRMA